MMRFGHETMAFGLAATEVWSGLSFTPLPWIVLAIAFALTQHSSGWPDLDMKTTPINRDLGPLTQAVGWIIRWVSWRVYLLTRNNQDKIKPRGDCHRDFTHTIEGCSLFAATVGAVTHFIPWIGQYWWVFSLAVLIGTVSHIIADWPSPAGVPWSLIYNMLTKGGNWRRHRLGKMEVFRVGAEGEPKVIAVIWVINGLLILTYTGLLNFMINVLLDRPSFDKASVLILGLFIIFVLIVGGVLYRTYKAVRK